jgi:hypothetical protein
MPKQEITLINGERFYTGLGHRPFANGETLHVSSELAADLAELGIIENPSKVAAAAAPAEPADREHEPAQAPKVEPEAPAHA